MYKKLLMGIVLSFLSGASIDAVCGMESDRPNENNPSHDAMRAQKEMRSDSAECKEGIGEQIRPGLKKFKPTNIEKNYSLRVDGIRFARPVKESWLSYNPDPRYIMKEYDKFVIGGYKFYVAPTDTGAIVPIYNTIEDFVPIYNVINFISRKIELEYDKSHYTYNQQKILDNLRGVGNIPKVVWGDIKLDNQKLDNQKHDAVVNTDIKIYSKALAYIYTAYLYNNYNNNGAFENPVAFRDFINKCPDDKGILNNENILKKLCEWGCLTLKNTL